MSVQHTRNALSPWKARVDDESRVAAEDGAGSSRVNRRTVLRAAMHTAWVVPTVQFVSAAPAFAAASDGISFTKLSGKWKLSNSPSLDYVTVKLTVNNNSTTDQTNMLQLMLIFPNLYVYGSPLAGGPIGDQTMIVSDISPLTWGIPSVTVSGTTTTRQATVMFTPSLQIPIGGSSALTFRATTSTDVTKAIAKGGTDTITPITAIAKAANNTPFVSGTGVISPK